MTDHALSRYFNVDPPSAIHLASDRRSLRIVWGDQEEQALTAQLLRGKCRSSDSIRARIDGSPTPISSDLMIERIELVGSYALNLSFSDGEDRGIYPWALLREIAREQTSGESN
jgi:DUF971 family protein